MSSIEFVEVVSRQKKCFKVKSFDIDIGLVYLEGENNWRVTLDLKGEYWRFEEFGSREAAVEFLVERNRELNEYRLGLLKSGN